MKRKTIVSKIVDRFFELDNPKDFAVWFETNCANLKEDASKELIEAHSTGIRFMAETSSIPQPASISWFRTNYETI